MTASPPRPIRAPKRLERNIMRGDTLLLLMRLRTVIALIVVLAVFSAAAPNFLSSANMVLMLKHVALNAILAIGLTYVIVAGGIALSVGSTVGLTGMVAGFLMLNGVTVGGDMQMRFNLLEIILIVLAIGVLIGLINGVLVARPKVDPFKFGRAACRARVWRVG